MNWFHREERRYVEYGSSFSAARRFGIARQLTDTVFNMNAEHLPADVPTVFESLDDADVRTAGTTYLMYRGRHRHELSRETALTRAGRRRVLRRPVMGPRELFYADIFASRDDRLPLAARHAGRARPARRLRRRLPRRARPLRLPAALAARQRHALAQARPARAGRRRSPTPTASSSACSHAGRRRRRVPRRARGDRHGRPLARAGRAPHRPATTPSTTSRVARRPSGARRDEAEIAVCPAQRSAMVYALVPRTARRARRRALVDAAARRSRASTS